jgi:cell division septation protein DedD
LKILIVLVWIALAVVNLVAVARGKRIRAYIQDVSTDRRLEKELCKIKFGPEGELARRETAERIGRIR